MKIFVISLLNIYQKIISPLLHQLLGQRSLCRYDMSCSEFAKNKIKKYGIITGIKMGLVRFLSCQPFIKTYANI